MVVQGKDPGFVRNAEAGAFWDLTDKLDDYPNLKTTFPEVQQSSSVNGKVYGVFRARDVMRAAVIDPQGLAGRTWDSSCPRPPRTCTRSPRRSPRTTPTATARTTPTASSSRSGPAPSAPTARMTLIETWFGAGNRWAERDGKLVPGFDHRRVPRSGPVRAEDGRGGARQPRLRHVRLGASGTSRSSPARAASSSTSTRVSAQLISLFKQTDPENFENFVDVTGNLTGPDGELYAYPTSGYSGFLAIPKAQVRTEEELQRRARGAEQAELGKDGADPQQRHRRLNFTVDGDLAVGGRRRTAGADRTPSSAYAQLGMNVNGFQGYLPKQPSEYEQEMYDKRNADRGGRPRVRRSSTRQRRTCRRPTWPRARSWTTSSPTRASSTSPVRSTRAGSRTPIELWHSSGGDDIIAEINELADANS